MSRPIRVSVDGQSSYAPRHGEFGSQLKQLTMFPNSIGTDQTARLEEEMRAAIESEMPEIARAFKLAIAILQDEIIVSLTSRSVVDQLGDLERE